MPPAPTFLGFEAQHPKAQEPFTRRREIEARPFGCASFPLGSPNQSIAAPAGPHRNHARISLPSHDLFRKTDRISRSCWTSFGKWERHWLSPCLTLLPRIAPPSLLLPRLLRASAAFRSGDGLKLPVRFRPDRSRPRIEAHTSGPILTGESACG